MRRREGAQGMATTLGNETIASQITGTHTAADTIIPANRNYSATANWGRHLEAHLPQREDHRHTGDRY